MKFKEDGELAYHLGADYFLDPDGTMASQPKKYVEKLKETYIRLFNEEPPKGLKTPLDKNDYPEPRQLRYLSGNSSQSLLDNGGSTSMADCFGEI